MSRPFSVLLVEDDDPLRHILVELLREQGFHPYATDHGREALELAREVKPDVGILDMHLPGFTGLQLFNAIHQEIGPLPSIMMSGEATWSEKEAALAAGVFTFLRKPIEMPHLQRCLDLLIQHHFPMPDSR